MCNFFLSKPVLRSSHDSALIAHAMRGASDAFGDLVTRYQTNVFNVSIAYALEET